MRIEDVRKLTIISTSEDEHGQYDVQTKYERFNEKMFQRSYYTTNKYDTMCKNCGTWNAKEDHICMPEYVTNRNIIEEVEELQNDESVRIYINGKLI